MPHRWFVTQHAVPRHELTSISRHFDAWTKHRAYRRRTEADKHLRIDDLQFRGKPGATGNEMRKVRRTMQTPFRRLRKPEMLHSIGDVRVRRVDACLGKGHVQQSAGRSDERLTLPVLLVSWLLTNEDNAREW
jgi:hypothetical protein